MSELTDCGKELRDGRQSQDRHVSFQGGSTALLTIHYGEDTKDAASGFPDGRNRLACRTTGRDHVFNHDDGIALLKRTLNQPARAVGLGLLADGERPYGRARERAGIGNRERNRVGAKRQSANRIRLPTGVCKPVETERPDRGQPLRAHGGQPGVDVVGGLPTGRQGERSPSYGAFGKQLDEAVLYVHALRLSGDSFCVNARADQLVHEAMKLRGFVRPSTVGLAIALLGIAGALGIADAATRGAPLRRAAFWLALGVSAIAVAVVHVYERRQAHRIEERSAELEQLSGELYRANRAKAEFLASVSHELRTPLAAIVGFVDLLRDGSYGELTPRQRGPVERIESSANHLMELVEQVLDLAKVAAGRLEVHPEPVGLRPFIIDVVSEMEPLASARGLNFAIHVPATLPRVTTDVSHLRRILVNLVGNAIKFTNVGSVGIRAQHVNDDGLADMVAGLTRRPLLLAHGPWVAIQVSDTGIGIAAADLERVFEDFEQVNPGPRADSARRGTGLGLTISRRLARLLDGDITVASAPGRGSSFTLWLPAHAPPAP